MIKTDVLIAGCGCAGLYCAMNLPRSLHILMVTKADLESSDSYLAQGGMCMLKDESDYQSYFEDTMRAGHEENDRRSVEIMIRSSRPVVQDLISYGARFHREPDGSLSFTREGAHRHRRIIYHEDVTGKEITSSILEQVKKLPNVVMMEYTTLLDIIEDGSGECAGAVVRMKDGSIEKIAAQEVVLATGGIGGLYVHSTNFRQLTGDAVAIAIRHGMRLKNVNYIQIHPTTFYSPNKEDRSFLISESVRGEGAKLYDKHMHRFVNELLPRDLLTDAIYAQMAKDGTDFVWEDLRPIPEDQLREHFPNIVEHCREMGYDVTRECIPVVPAQHYYMGGVWVDHESRTSMHRLYTIGEAACNGVHGRNRLASNSLLESLVFARRAAHSMLADNPALAAKSGLDADTLKAYAQENADAPYTDEESCSESDRVRAVEDYAADGYQDAEALQREYAKLVKDEIRRANSMMAPAQGNDSSRLARTAFLEEAGNV